jgi:hypothetical protein
VIRYKTCTGGNGAAAIEDTEMTIAQTVLEQLGGNRFLAMTGARALVNTGTGLRFDLPRAKSGINKVAVELTPADEYTVRAYRYSRRTLECPEVATREHIQAADLRRVFTTLTGLECSL